MTRTGVAPQPSVLSIKPFRRLWIGLSLAALGEWLSVLTLTALAALLTRGDGFQTQSYAVGGVLVLKMLPAVVLGPAAGALADRFDRRLTMVVADVLRFALLVSIPLVGSLGWLLAGTFLVECVTLLWSPAKQGVMPGLVPADRLAQANRVDLMTTYGSAPVAAGLFSVLALLSGTLFGKADRADLALYVNATVFLLSAIVILTLGSGSGGRSGPVPAPSVLKQIGEGWRFATGTPMTRGLIIGLVAVSAAVGTVIGVAKIYAQTLGGGDAGYGVLFGAVFLGLAFGMFLGPRMLRGFSRGRLLGLSIVAAGLVLACAALIQNLVVVVVLTALLGVCAGVAWVTGYALAGSEVPELRGSTFAFLQSLVRVALLVVLALMPLLAGVIGRHRLEPTDDSVYSFNGTSAVLLIAALVALLGGVAAYRQMDDRRGIPLAGDLLATLRGVPYSAPDAGAAAQEKRDRGVFISFEGGDGAGKTTQSRLAAIWLRDHGYEVVSTSEPGATKIGMRLRAILLDKETTGLSSRAETLLYAADRADHVANVIKPALERGAIVVTDRYVDSSLAYQGYGRSLPIEEIAGVNSWATAGLVPDLTILLDVPPETGFGRLASPADRMESEPQEFHERVRRGFRKLAEADPDRYLILDAGLPQAQITRLIQDRVREILPDPIPAGTEDITSTFPAITDA